MGQQKGPIFMIPLLHWCLLLGGIIVTLLFNFGYIEAYGYLFSTNLGKDELPSYHIE